MSIANLQDPAKLQSGLDIYAHSVSAAESKFGPAGSQISLPTLAPTAIGQIMRVSPDLTHMAFTGNSIGQLTLGGNCNGNPRFLAVGGNAALAVSAGADFNSQFVLPYDCRLFSITWGSQGMNATTQWVLQQAAATTNILINSNPFSPVGITFTAGVVNSISWRGVGTQPNETSFILWLERI